MLASMAGDRELIQIVDAALAEANRKAGEWLVCRRGCFDCCLGPFPISALDAVRLRAGLAELETADPARAAAIRERARVWRGGDDDSCPALDPATGACELYAARPLTCRTFGPAIRIDDGELGICELNFEGVSDEQIEACAVEIGTVDLEAELLAGLPDGETTVALVLAG